MTNKIIHKKNIEKFIQNYTKEAEGNRVYSSVFYYYYNIINHKEPFISYKSFISLFHNIYEKQNKKKLNKGSIRYQGTTLRTIENIELLVPSNITNLLNEYHININNDVLVVNKPQQNNISIFNKTSKNLEQHSKMFDKNMKEWLLTYCQSKIGNREKASIYIQHFSDKFLNGIKIETSYNQYFFKTLKKEAKLLWPDIEIQTENKAKKAGSAVIINLDFK